jgi:hypothetical protein
MILLFPKISQLGNAKLSIRMISPKGVQAHRHEQPPSLAVFALLIGTTLKGLGASFLQLQHDAEKTFR